MENEKKKRSVVTNVFSILLVLILILILAVAGFIAFCSFDKKQSLSVFPHNYSVYLHADSAWETVEPMLDLKAMDMFLSSPELSNVRGMFMQLRASQWRKNNFLSKLGSKNVDAAVYSNEEDKFNFIASFDLGSLAFISRAFPILYDKLSIKGLYRENDHFIFDANGSYYYIKPFKNLIIVSDSPELLIQAFEKDHNDYSARDLKLFSEKSSTPIKIIANISSLIKDSGEEETLISQVSKVFPENNLSLISVNISDEKIQIDAKIPIVVPKENYSLAPIFSKKSTTPAILSRFRENVQYYTILNAGSLEELKNAVLPLTVKDVDALWKKANSLSKSLLLTSLEDLLFSWSGNEIVMFGLENRNDPIFAIQISDEKQRQKIFDKFTSSMLIKHNASLILDGIRIPRLELPSFLQDLLKLFDISLPHPYYYIQDGFIYFSESAENLCEIYKSENKLNRISQNNNWKNTARDIGTECAVSLYYNLERSVPFFLKSNASISNVLSLYQIGRADLAFYENEMQINLSAISKDDDLGNKVPGFPIKLNGKIDGRLLSEMQKSNSKTNTLFWVENKKNISSMELPSTAINHFEMKDEVFIDVIPIVQKNGDGVLWAVTTHGEIYLMNNKLEVQKGFPILLDDTVSVPPFAGDDGLYIITDTGHLYWFDEHINKTEKYLDVSGSVKSTPTICNDKNGNRFIGIYDKSFLGKVIVIKEGKSNDTYKYDIPGIAYGSPAFLFNEKLELPYVAMVTQSGDLHIWNMNADSEIQVSLGNIFKAAPVACNGYFFAVSTNGVLYRIDCNGDFVIVEIPNATCNEAFVTVNDGNIYVCPDGNIIYGFDTNLELVYPFPVTGWGIPVFADVNGDNIPDCFTLSIDNKLNAIKMR